MPNADTLVSNAEMWDDNPSRPIFVSSSQYQPEGRSHDVETTWIPQHFT